jgi:hypothetical protein
MKKGSAETEHAPQKPYHGPEENSTQPDAPPDGEREPSSCFSSSRTRRFKCGNFLGRQKPDVHTSINCVIKPKLGWGLPPFAHWSLFVPALR